MAVAHPQLAALNRAALMALAGRLAAVVAALHVVILIVAHILAAGFAILAAGVIVMVLAIALRLAAPGTILVIRLDILSAAQRIDARTMIRIAAGRLMAAEGVIAPEQTAHPAGGMRIGVGAAIGIAAASLCRIAVVFLIALTDHVLRNSVAVLAHRLVQMRAHLAGEVAFHAAGCQRVVPAVAGIMTGMPQGAYV